MIKHWICYHCKPWKTFFTQAGLLLHTATKHPYTK